MTADLRAALRPAITLLLLLTLLLGLAYPLAVTGVAQTLMPWQAHGSLLRDGDRVVGSALIGQSFISPRYFQGRPSAAGQGYDANASSGSNLGPNERTLIERVAADKARLGGEATPDRVTASASGLDPHISPAAALAQAGRVASARGLPPAQVEALVRGSVEHASLGIVGEPRVNVLLLNHRLDAAARAPAR